MQNSQQTYADKYDKNGYGLLYPDGHIVRFYERILKYKMAKKPGNFLDFGCGNGVHSAYFQSKGYEVFGIDIVESLKQSYEKLTALRGGGGVNATLSNPTPASQGFLRKKWI